MDEEKKNQTLAGDFDAQKRNPVFGPLVQIKAGQRSEIGRRVRGSDFQSWRERDSPGKWKHRSCLVDSWRHLTLCYIYILFPL